MDAMKQKLKEFLSSRQKQHITETTLKPSAVLVPLFYTQGQYHILFTRRTEKVKDHKGQISFPGGAYEKGDRTLLETALRETAEEIGLKSRDVEVLGELDDTPSLTSKYAISPFVGLIPWPYKFEANYDETDEIIKVPISALLDNKCHYEETETYDGKRVNTYFYRYQGRVIWGATGRILHQLLEIITQVIQEYQR